MTSPELFAAMPQALAAEIFEFNITTDRNLYRAALDAVAQSRKVRAVFLERQPRVERHVIMAHALSRPALNLVASNLLSNWLLKKQTALLKDFLDALKIPHENGVVETLPPSVEEADLNAAVETLLAKYPADVTALYLHAFNHLNEARWPHLEKLLREDARLQLKRD